MKPVCSDRSYNCNKGHLLAFWRYALTYGYEPAWKKKKSWGTPVESFKLNSLLRNVWWRWEGLFPLSWPREAPLRLVALLGAEVYRSSFSFPFSGANPEGGYCTFSHALLQIQSGFLRITLILPTCFLEIAMTGYEILKFPYLRALKETG